MPETVTQEIYTFEELSEDVQARVIEKNCDFNVNYNWWNCTYEDAKMVGFKIESFDLDRDRYVDGDFTDTAEYAARAIIENHGETCETYILAKDYLAQLLIVTMKHTAEGGDDEDLDTLDIDEAFLKDLRREYHKILVKEYDYLTSDEAIRETMIANEYQFYEDGDFYHEHRKAA